eukprot:6485149-Amphidinium_carterae.1
MGCSLVLYRTARAPKRRHLADLVHCGFPLSVSELSLLDNLASGDADDLDDTIDSEEPVDKSLDDTDGDVANEVPLGVARDDRVSPEADCVRQKNIPPGAITESISLYKVKQDGLLREILLQTSVGTTVAQAILSLKVHLKLHPGKIMILLWDSLLAGSELASNATISSAHSYLIRVRGTSNRPCLASAPSSSASVLPSSQQVRPPIGARLQPHHSPGRPALAASSSAAVAPCSSSCTLAALRREGVVTSPFESWVAEKILQIETQQAQLASHLARGNAGFHQPKTTAPKAPAGHPIGARFKQGGAGGRAGNVRPSSLIVSRNVVLFVPSSDTRDSLMHCVRWILAQNKWQTSHSAEEAHIYLRTVARVWVASAYRNGYQCSPDLTTSPAFVIVYALSCLFNVQMFVLDACGCRMDSFIVSNGWGLQWHASSWVVVSAFPQPLPPCPRPDSPTSISPTLSWHDDMSVGSESLFEIVQGAGKVHRVQQEALSTNAFDLVIKDLKQHSKSSLDPKLVRH